MVAPQPSTWGDFGPRDALGRVNLLTPTKVAEGFREVREYRTFSLGLPLNLPGAQINANRHPPIHRPNLRDGQPNVHSRLDSIEATSTDVLNDDLVTLHTQYSSHWDAFAHIGSLYDINRDGEPKIVYYNGRLADVDVRGPRSAEDCGIPSGDPASTADFGELGIGTLAAHPIQGRAVMLDLAHHFGTERQLVGYEEIEHVIAHDQIEVRAGDIVTIHTGYADTVLKLGGAAKAAELDQVGAVLDGRDQRLLDWITRSQIVAIAADNYAIEQYPAQPIVKNSPLLPLHELCLFKLGVPLGELWYLTKLATHLRASERTAYLLTAPPLNLPGATASPLNPIATV